MSTLVQHRLSASVLHNETANQRHNKAFQAGTLRESSAWLGFKIRGRFSVEHLKLCPKVWELHLCVSWAEHSQFVCYEVWHVLYVEIKDLETKLEIILRPGNVKQMMIIHYSQIWNEDLIFFSEPVSDHTQQLHLMMPPKSKLQVLHMFQITIFFYTCQIAGFTCKVEFFPSSTRAVSGEPLFSKWDEMHRFSKIKLFGQNVCEPSNTTPQPFSQHTQKLHQTLEINPLIYLPYYLMFCRGWLKKMYCV